MTSASLVAIVGPTAVGKTRAALAMAENFEAEIVSADSRLLYRGMDIGTAKPSHEQLRRVPHHLIDVAEPEESWSLAQFKSAADVAIADIQQRRKLPVLVGGTGQYVTAILEGWQPPPKAPDDTIRRTHEDYAAKEGALALHSKLKAADPVSAEEIDPKNVRRVARALEVFELTGTPASDQRRAEPPEYRTLRLGLTMPREQLYARIDRRIDRMLEIGLVNEVRGLLDRGIDLDHPPMSSIGYRQIGEYLLGERSMEDATAEMRTLTRRLVRSQANWFKGDDPGIEWFEAEKGVVNRMVDRTRSWLGAT